MPAEAYTTHEFCERRGKNTHNSKCAGSGEPKTDTRQKLKAISIMSSILHNNLNNQRIQYSLTSITLIIKKSFLTKINDAKSRIVRAESTADD